MSGVRVDRLGADFEYFVGEVFESLTRAGWHERCGSYLQGLLLDGRRKSIQPMAARLSGVHDQALNHFITNSPWPVEPVRRRLAVWMDLAVAPAAWAVDDTGWLKDGPASPCVWPQYTGSAGKITNCQIGVSLNLVTDTASCPVNWRLFVPEAWDPASGKAMAQVAARRRKAAIPEQVGHREKWRLALDLIDQTLSWGIRPPLIVADAGYGDCAEFRQGLDDRVLSYVVGVACTHTAFTEDTVRTAPPYKGNGRRPPLIYRQKAPSLKTLVLAVGQDRARVMAWREGSRRRGGTPVKMRSRFVFLRVRPTSKVHRRAVDFGDLPWQGWHHHVTLVSAAHAFVTLQRLDPKTHAPE